jgi:uncharacterized protein involved in exopolysaccharide biosynthesis
VPQGCHEPEPAAQPERGQLESATSVWKGERDLADVSSSLATTAGAIRRNAAMLLVWALICNGLAIIYLKLVRPEFIASAQVLLQPRHIANDGPEDARHYHQFALDSEQSETELRVLRSERILAHVFTALQLADSAELRGRNGFWSGLARQLHRLVPGAMPIDERRQTYYAFADRVRSRRIGLSYVIEVSYSSRDAQLAARVANAVASAYVSDRLSYVAARAQTGSPYLRSRASFLASESLASDDAVRSGSIPSSDMPDSDVRILGSAVAPSSPVYPKTGPILALASAFGLVSGLMVILLTSRLIRRRLARRPVRLRLAQP